MFTIRIYQKGGKYTIGLEPNRAQAKKYGHDFLGRRYHWRPVRAQ